MNLPLVTFIGILSVALLSVALTLPTVKHTLSTSSMHVNEFAVKLMAVVRLHKVNLANKTDHCLLLMLSFIAGHTLCLSFETLLADQLIISSAIILLFVCIGTHFSHAHLSTHFMSAIAVGFLFGLALANNAFDQHKQDRLNSQLEGVTLMIEGYVNTLPNVQFDSSNRAQSRFHFVIQTIRHPDLADHLVANLIDKKVLLNCYRCPFEFKQGQSWRLSVRLKRPRGYASWGAFSYEKYLFRHQLIATGYILVKEQNTILANSTHWSGQLRAKLKQQLMQLDQANDHHHSFGYGILRALTIGDKSGLSSEQKETLQSLGLSHLVAISGLHIGLIFLVVARAFRVLLSPFAILYQCVSRPSLLLFPSLMAAVVYATLAGFAVSTQRALIMLTVYTLIRISARPASLIRVLIIAVSILLLIDPFSILDTGFWLSCTAVLVIAFAQRSHNLKPENVNLITLQPLIWLGMLPLSITLFAEVSLISPVVNIVAVPLFCLLLIPITLFAMLTFFLNVSSVSDLLFHYLAIIYEHVLDAFALLNHWPYAQLSFPPLSELSLVLFVLVFILFVLISRWRYTALVLVSGWVLVNPMFSNSDELTLTLVDVGQGLAMVVTVEDYVLVYDTGPKYPSGFSAAKASLIPYLRHRNIHHVDTLIISHADNDHFGGFETLKEKFPITDILTSRTDLIHSAKDCQRGDTWFQKDVTFTIVSPDKRTPKGSNNRSCVLKIESPTLSLLITGDIEKKVEQYLLSTQQDLTADILLVPHQGSKTSSTLGFIQAVQPKLALLAAGYRNQYRHPNTDVMQRYAALGIEVLSTIESGSIQITSEKKTIQINEFRKDQRSFWLD